MLRALKRCSRSGRVAQQFARDYAGRDNLQPGAVQPIADVDGLTDGAEI